MRCPHLVGRRPCRPPRRWRRTVGRRPRKSPACALPENGSVVSQRSAPVALSNARNFRSKFVAPMKTSPPAVTIRPAVVLGAGIRQALGRELGILAKRHTPDEVARVEVDGIQRAPRRRDRRVAIGIEELAVAGEAIRDERRRGVCSWRRGGWPVRPVAHEVDDRGTRRRRQVRESGHAARALLDDG